MAKIWALIVNSMVAELTDIDPDGRFHPSFIWVDAPETAAVGDMYVDGVFTAPVPDMAEIEMRKVAVVQSHMDEAARALRFDSLANAITYAEEPAVPLFQAQGRALRAWRSLVWEASYSILDAVKAGTRAIPEDAELLAVVDGLRPEIPTE
jgi:hypothetical protein